MNPIEIIPLFVVVLLLLTASGNRVDQMEIVMDGSHDVTDVQDVLVVGGGTATVPTSASVSGTIFVIGGDVRLNGTVHGDVRQLAGNLSIGETAHVDGTLQVFSGRTTIDDEASVSERTSFEVVPQERSPASVVGWFVVQTAILAVAGVQLLRRKPRLLRNVGDSITEHTVVSGVVGSLASVTLLVLFVFMAFTLILLPISLLGIVGGVVVIAYSLVVYGYLLGRLVPFESPTVSLVVGIVGLRLAVELLGQLPLVGGVVQLALAVVGVGAVLITYFGLREFEPARIPAVAE